MFKNASKIVCTSTVVVSHDLLSPAPPPSSAIKTPQNKQEESDGPEQADEMDIPSEYSAAQVQQQYHKTTCKYLGQYRGADKSIARPD